MAFSVNCLAILYLSNLGEEDKSWGTSCFNSAREKQTSRQRTVIQPDSGHAGRPHCHLPLPALPPSPLRFSIVYALATFREPLTYLRPKCSPPPCLSQATLALGSLFDVVIVICCSHFLDRVPFYSPSCPGSHYVDQVGLKITTMHLSLPPKYWD